MELKALVRSLKSEGWEVKKTHLAFPGEEQSMCQGVRIFMCHSGRKHISFVGGLDQAIHVIFMEMQSSLSRPVECKTIEEVMSYVRSGDTNERR